jgi:hypothetical protein
MRLGLAWLLGAALALAGCDDRRAGTETGNPEIVVSARFLVSSYSVTQTRNLPFRVMGMGYSVSLPSGVPDSGKCWSRPGGTLADLAASEAVPLADTLIEDKGPWLRTEIVLRAPDHPAGIPDSADIATWSSPRYAKFDRSTAVGIRTYLFEMPEAAEYRLQFGTEESESWRFGDSIWVPIHFDAETWTDTLASIRGLVSRRDIRNAPYFLLSPGENAAGWRALKAKLPESFYADSVIVR